MIMNGGSPIIQNFMNNGGVPMYGTPTFQTSGDAGGSSFSYDPASRFQNNFMGNIPMGYEQPTMYTYQQPVYDQQYVNYNQMTYSQPMYNYQQPMYNQPQYGQVTYQQPMYNQPQYSQMSYQQPMYNQNQYGFNMYNNQYGYNPQMMNGRTPDNRFGGGSFNRDRYAINGISLGYVQPQFQDTKYIQQGFNTVGELMFSSEDLDRFNAISDNMINEQYAYEDRLAQSSINYGGYNYFGQMSPYNSFISSKYDNQYYQIIEEARERAKNFNKRLSRIAHNYLNDGVDDDYIDSIYDAREVIIPAADIESQCMSRKFDNFTVDYGELTRIQYNIINNQISEKYKSGLDNVENMNLTEFLNSAGQIYAQNMQNDVVQNGYNMNYRFDRSIFKRRINAESQFANLFPTLAQSSTMLTDGSLEIKPPAWIGKGKESEENYNISRQKFIDSIYNNRRSV